MNWINAVNLVPIFFFVCVSVCGLALADKTNGCRSLLNTNGVISLTTVIQLLMMGHTLWQPMQLSVITGRWVSGSNLIACKIREKEKGSMGVLHYGNYPFSIGGFSPLLKVPLKEAMRIWMREFRTTPNNRVLTGDAQKSLRFNVKSDQFERPQMEERTWTYSMTSALMYNPM